MNYVDAVETTEVVIEQGRKYSPHQNPQAISLIKQEDGNWIGEMDKHGVVISLRQGDPQIVLQMLLTHE